jgi:hypothetical protein
MPIRIQRIDDYDTYSALLDDFQRRMDGLGTPEGERRASFSEERAKGDRDAQRYVARNDDGVVVGWMILKPQHDSLKVEGICSDHRPEFGSGVSKALMVQGVNESLQAGKDGALTLTNSSQGSGDRFYAYMGFQSYDGDKMRMTPSNHGQVADPPTYPHWQLNLHPTGTYGKHGNEISVASLSFVEKTPQMAEARTVHPTRDVEPTPRERYPMFDQALRAIERSDLPIAKENAEQHATVAAALAAQAHEGKLTQIDHVVAGTKGGQLFAVQGDPKEPESLRASVGLGAAQLEPMARSFERLERPVAEQAQGPAQAQALHPHH